MSAATDVMSDDLAAVLADSLERERQLGRVYRQQIQAAWSPRVRRLWEDGWTLKRGHEDALARLLADSGEKPRPEALEPLATPSPREVLSWSYEQERLLALRYHESARLAPDPETHGVLARLADEQRRFLDRVRATYRDYSAA